MTSIGILGGGITGLTLGYLLATRLPKHSITIIEATERTGGWINSKRVELRDGRTSGTLTQYVDELPLINALRFLPFNVAGWLVDCPIRCCTPKHVCDAFTYSFCFATTCMSIALSRSKWQWPLSLPLVSMTLSSIGEGSSKLEVCRWCCNATDLGRNQPAFTTDHSTCSTSYHCLTTAYNQNATQ
jgi:hypothetical protein